MSSNKLPQGRHLSGVSVVYDVDVRRPGEFQPQLEVRSTITNYDSDPQQVLGRQIAVNKSYICYGLKQGIIRVMNNHNGLECLFRTHTQRVTDMTFFAEDVHQLASVSVEGRLSVWKFSEGLGGTPQIKGKIVIAIQIVDEGEVVHPRVCWHCSKQEVLFVGVGKRVIRIDTTKVAKCGVPSAEDPIKCPVEKLIDGVQFVGEHDGEVTDLSMCQGMTTTRLVSASMDGTIKIWEDRKSQPLIVLRPYDGLPVYSSIFMTAPNKPDHIILVTVGPLNREVKIWSSATEVLTSDDESWKCTQTLELKSSAQPRVEDAFFNQVIALSQAGLLLLANAKKNAIYAVHIDFGGEPAATHMDYIAEFTVTMPILSFTGTSISPHGEQIVQVYCVQTQAIQQYALDLSKCLPPPLENTDTVDSNTELELQRQIDAMQDEMNQLEIMQTKLQTELQEWKKTRKDNTDALKAGIREEISKNEKLWRERIQQGTVERTDFPVLLDKLLKKEIAALGSAIETKNILAISDCFQKLEKSVNSNLEATVRSQIQVDFQTPGNQIRQGDGASMSEPLAQLHYVEEDQEQSAKDVSGSATATTTSQLQTPNAKSRKQEWKNMQASGPSSPSLGVLNSVESFNEAGGSLSPPSRQAAVPQRMAMHDLVKQLCDEEREYLKKLRARAATVLDRIKKEEAEKKKKIAKDEVSSVLNLPIMFKRPIHGDARIQDVLVNSDVGNPEVNARSTQIEEFGCQQELQNAVSEDKKFFCSQASDLGIVMARNFPAISSEFCITEEARQGDGASMSEPLSQLHYVEEDQEQFAKDVSGSATATTTSQLQTPNAKSRKQEWKNMQASGPSSPSLGVLNSVESFNEAGGSLSPPSRQAAVPQRMAMHNLVKQLCDEDREYLQKLRARTATVLDRIKKEEAEKKKKIAKDEVSSVLNPRIMFRHPSHPITPSESLMDASPSESTSTWAANGTGWW